MALTRILSDLQDTYTYPLICDDISPLFDGLTMVFTLRVSGVAINTVADSKNVQVLVNGQIQRPYISEQTEQTFPWLSDYVPNGFYRVVGSSIIFYNPPAQGDICSLIITTAATYQRQAPKNFYSANIIAFGD